jgi:D-mannonate dehydratase
VFQETKVLKIDSYALQNEVTEIKDAIQNLINEKIIYIRKNYNPAGWYKTDLKEKNTLQEKYTVEFYDINTKEVMGYLRINIKVIGETENVEQQ